MFNIFKKVPDKINCEISKFINRRYEKSIRSRLKNEDFSIICSNCIGGTIYNRSGKSFYRQQSIYG